MNVEQWFRDLISARWSIISLAIWWGKVLYFLNIFCVWIYITVVYTMFFIFKLYYTELLMYYDTIVHMLCD